MKNVNECTLIGTLKESQYEDGVKFYYMDIPRLSEKVDTIRVRFTSDVDADLFIGKRVELIDAHIRSFTRNKKLYIYILAVSLEETEKNYCNKITIDSVVVKQPIYRETPLGRTILDLLIVSNYKKANYIPALMWDKIAQRNADLKVADHIRLTGMLQSRAYTNSKQESHIAYEFSVSRVDTEDNDNGSRESDNSSHQ